GRVGADNEDHLRVFALVEGGGDRAGTDAFHQSRNRGGVAGPRTVIDVVGAKAGAYQLLEEICLFVRSLGRAEAGQSLRSVAVADLLQTRSRAVERLVPCGFAKMRPRIRRIDKFVRNFRHAVLADHWLGQPLRIVNVVEAVAAFHAQPLLVRRAVLAGDVKQLVVLDVIGELAADAAIRTDAVNRAVGLTLEDVVGVDKRRGHQCAGRAGLHAFAAAHAG